jgi:hypothetical protein
VLSDPGNQIAGQLGILTAPSDGTRAAQLQLGLDLTQVNADGTTGLPIPAVVIADADGVIRWIDVHPDYTCGGAKVNLQGLVGLLPSYSGIKLLKKLKPCWRTWRTI